MNIYDEKKVITHEEIKDRVIRCYRKHSYLDSISRFRILDYITQCEAKEKRAKKVEEELEEYKISDKSKEESSIEYYNLYKETKRKLKKVEELLGLYREYYGHIPYSNSPRIKYCEEKIDELEKELEEMK